jgi:predicted TIM-barrel fold metal-dependent hydrolase
MSLLYSGVFERYSNVRFIFSHCGGIMPYLAHRMVRGETWTKGEGGADPGLLDEPPNGYRVTQAIGFLQRQYYDTMTANGANGLRTLQAFVGSSHVLFGTDHAILPRKYQPIKVRELMSYKGFDDAARMNVERGNALRLFPRLREVL